MQLFEYMSDFGYEQLVMCADPASGLKALIAIHDTTLGPACGGTRIWPYATEEEALRDALRLGRAMTYKSATAGLNLGGGKGVIIADPNTQKTEALLPGLWPLCRYSRRPLPDHHRRGQYRPGPGIRQPGN